jgi:NADH:ubiquinone oxidoreductase subunit B-like Fe-S oxidoreductase
MVVFDSYNILPGVDNILPAGVYVLGCPPRPETLIQAIMLLQERKSKKRNEESVKLVSFMARALALNSLQVK